MYTSFQALTTHKTPFGISLMPFTYIYAQAGPAIEICDESAHLPLKTRKSMCEYAHPGRLNGSMNGLSAQCPNFCTHLLYITETSS